MKSFVKSIKVENFEGFVYNIEVEDNHNYFANNILVSNCHEGSTINGKHGDILSPSFLDNLHPYTELAIGGGNVLEHPDIDEFLKRCKDRKFICNITVNQKHFIESFNRIKDWVDNKLVYGVGVSLNKPSHEFIKLMNLIPNSVLHVIAGLVSLEDLEFLSKNNLKVLVLGYKQVRR